MAGGLTSAPVNTVPTEVIDVFSASYAFDGSIQVDDADGGPLTVELTAGSGYGTLEIQEVPPGLTVTGNNSYNVVLQGSIADINAALRTLVYEPYEGFSDVLYIETSDGERSDSDQIFLDTNVESTNEAPVNTTPTETIRIAPGGSYVFDGTIAVEDQDNPVLTVTLNGGSGYIYLNYDPENPGSLEVCGNGSDNVTVTGTIADINAALNGLEYEHDSESGGSFDTILVSTTDDDYTDVDQIHFNVADLALDEPATAIYRDTQFDDTFDTVTGVLSSTGNDPVYAITGGVPSSTLPGYDQKVIGTHGTLYLNSATGAYAFVPLDAAIEGLGSREFEVFGITVTDGEDTAGTEITIDLRGVNDRPSLDLSVAAATLTDTAGNDSFSPVTGELTGEDRDACDSLTYDLVGGTPTGIESPVLVKAGLYGTLSLNRSTGKYLYAPDEEAIEGLKSTAQDIFTFTVTDEDGLTTSKTFKVTLDGANDAPEISATVSEASYTDTAGDDAFAVTRGRLTGTDRDLGDDLSYEIAGGAASSARTGFDIAKTGDHGTLFLNSGTGAYIFVPSDSAIEGLKGPASETFTLLVRDESGATASETFTVDLQGANDLPELSGVPNASFADTSADDRFAPVSGRLTSSDRDLGDSATFEISGGTASDALPGYDTIKAGDYGTLYLNSRTGAYRYLPSDAAIEGLKGPASETFTLLVRDESGATASETFTVDLQGANDRPEGRDDSYSVDAGGTLRVARLAGILRNDSDRDDAALDAVLVNGPRHGTLTLNANGSFVYRPDSDFSRSGGTDSFTYNASDGSFGSGPTRVTINVEPDGAPDNRPPVATADNVAVAEDRTSLAERVVTGNVLANDSDPDAGDVLHVATLNGVALGAARVLEGRFGTLTLRADGSYSYAFSNTDALIAGETGIERFAYTIADGEGRTDTAFLTFTIDGADLKLSTSGTLVAHRGGDEITGMSGADRIAGRRGNDLLEGEGGNDMLWGEEGEDRILGGLGDDQGIGGSGNDTITLGDGDDRGWGETGNDTLRGEDGNDRLDGGIGDDSIDLGFGDDRGWGSLGNDAIVGGAGADWLNGGAGTDSLVGGTGDDELWGESENDVLDGGLGNDRMSAGSGNDTILMGAGDDTAWGGTGGDRFAFSAGFGRDVIKDFDAGDRIVFDGVFASFAAVQSAMRVNGGNIVIDGPNGHTITIENVTRLDSGDFIFI